VGDKEQRPIEHWSGPAEEKPSYTEFLRRYFVFGGVPRQIFGAAPDATTAERNILSALQRNK
jgi:hypothetical protein